MMGVPGLVYIFDKGKNQIRPFMYKYYLILCFCIEESNTREFLVLVTEFKLVASSVLFVCKDFNHNNMLYIRYFCNERSPNRNSKDYRNVVSPVFW